MPGSELMGKAEMSGTDSIIEGHWKREKQLEELREEVRRHLNLDSNL